jgi:DNA transposition AAA+ family ATPase
MSTTIGPRASTNLASVARATVRTSFYVHAQTVAQTALERSFIGGIFGEPGTGKTTAITDFCAASGVPFVYISTAVLPQRKELYEEILLGSVGGFDEKAPARVLRRECEAVLKSSSWIVVVDDCHHLRNLWHQQLRGLHDQAEFCLLLVGTNDAADTLKRDGQLWSRVKVSMKFAPLSDDNLITTLRGMHPVLANTERNLLEEIDRRDCRGNLRAWSAVLDLALALVANTTGANRLSERVAAAILFQRGR